MAYPDSFDVFDGMPTAYQHYNNLRGDSLYFGQTAANAVTVGQMMASYETRMNLQIIEPKRLRVAASAAAPVSIMIGGYPLQAVADVDLSAGLAPAGVASQYFVFAVRTAGATGFTLDINTTATETSTRRLIGLFYYDGTKIVKESIRTLTRELLGSLYGLGAQEAGGRLTLISGSPSGDALVGCTEVYYTPASSGGIALYAPGFGWKITSFAEVTLPLAGLTAGNYDVFISNVNGEGFQPTLSAVKWSSDSARATAIVRQNGVWVRSGALEQRYLGTIRLYAVGLTIDSPEQRFVWNAYNQVARRFAKRGDASSWTYAASSTWRNANASAANRVELVCGLDDTYVEMCVSVAASVTGGGAQAGILRDAVDANPTTIDPVHVITGYMQNMTASVVRSQLVGVNQGMPEIGYHYYQWVEWAVTATVTFFGQTSSGVHGIYGSMMG
jgi:hypothetical protein